MNAQELRIGNYINWANRKSDARILNLADFNIVCESLNNNEPYFKPIPLTEEWLLKFGFEKRGIRFNKNGLLLWLDMGRFVFALFESDSKIERNTLLISVHQLQNLYFALTGEELTIQQ